MRDRYGREIEVGMVVFHSAHMDRRFPQGSFSIVIEVGECYVHVEAFKEGKYDSFQIYTISDYIKAYPIDDLINGFPPVKSADVEHDVSKYIDQLLMAAEDVSRGGIGGEEWSILFLNIADYLETHNTYTLTSYQNTSG